MLFMLTIWGCSQEKDSAQKENQTSDSADTAVVVEQGICEQLGLEVVPFDDDPPSARYGNIVADFTLETTEGPWSFSESWTGCESYLFLNLSSRL